MEAHLSTEHVQVHGNADSDGEPSLVPELPPEVVARIAEAAARVETDRERLSESRRLYRQTIASVRAEGYSLSAIGRALGVSRQHIKRIIDGE